MSDLKLNTEGDIEITNGELSLIDGLDAIIQHLKIRLQFFLGEWFIDETAGVPYFQQIFNTKNVNLPIINSIFTREILNTPGVLSLTNLVFNYENGSRNLNINFSAITTDGVLDFTDILEV